MLLISTRPLFKPEGKSTLLATQKLKKGDSVWKLTDYSTSTYWRKQFVNYCYSLDIEEIRSTLNSSYIKNGIVYQLFDDTRLIKHSMNANLAFISPELIIAIEDIQEGDELSLNYFLSFDSNSYCFWELAQGVSKEELIQEIKDKTLIPGRPKRKLLA